MQLCTQHARHRTHPGCSGALFALGSMSFHFPGDVHDQRTPQAWIIIKLPETGFAIYEVLASLLLSLQQTYTK